MTLSIGTFAQLGGVTVRMLRHYDQIGLLPPARVHPDTGHRTYELEQLVTLNRIVALKGLGFTLGDVTRMLHEGVTSAELHGMLRLRQAQLERQIHHQQHRLNRVAARLHLIERENVMTNAVGFKRLGPRRLVALSATAPEQERASVGSLVERLFIRVADLMDEVGGDRTDPIARYIPSAGEEAGVLVTAGYVSSEDTVPGLDVVEFPEVEVATVIHQGKMADIAQAYQELGRWAQTNDRVADIQRGRWREVYLEAEGEDQRGWIVEVQLELT